MNTRKLALGLMVTAATLASMSFVPQPAQAEESHAVKKKLPLPARVVGAIAQVPLSAGSKMIDATSVVSEKIVDVQLPRPVRLAFTPVRATAAGVNLALLGIFHSRGMFTDCQRSDTLPRAAVNCVTNATPCFLIGSYAVTKQDLRAVIKGGDS